MKIKGIKELCSATKRLSPVGYLPRYKIQVHVDKVTGKLWWADVVGSGYIQYNDDNLIFVCNIEHPTKMKDIKSMVMDTLTTYFNACERMAR